MPSVETDIRTAQVLKSRTFWHIALAFTLQFIGISAIIAHIMPFLNYLGIARSTSGMIAAGIPVISIIGRFGSGWLGDKFNKKLIAVVSLAIMTVSVLLFDYVSNELIWLLALSVILFSISYGCGFTMRAILPREYFGRSKFGTIFGFVMGVVAVGSILGPFLAGLIFDTWSSYHHTILLCSW